MTSLQIQYLQALGFFAALMIALLAVPLVSKIALAFGLVDQPGERKIHHRPIPRMGGVGIWLGFVIGFLVVAYVYGKYPSGHTGSTGILIAGSAMFLLGLLDDIYNLSPYVKLAGQFAIAILAYYLGIQINALDLPGGLWLVLHDLSLPVTVLWLVGLTNAMNFIDGVDGLAGGVATISAITLAVVAVFTFQPIAAIFAALLAGASMGFLVYNTHPAKVFMGDGGALFIGFVLACIAITGVLKTQIAVMLVPVVILSVPILDIVYSTFRRLLRGKNPFKADADHLHHRLLQRGVPQWGIVGIMYVVCIISGMLATSYVHDLESYIVLLIGVGLLFAALLTLRASHDAEKESIKK